jgi:uncharacterized membrane protein YfcA
MSGEFLLVYLGVGAGAGVIAGLFGVGGGLIIVPALVLVFQHQGVDDTLLVHLAVGTSLATIVLTSIASVRAHDRRGAVRWDILRRLAPGIVIGALLGAAIAHAMPTRLLRSVFGVFELGVALLLWWNRQPAAHRRLPGTAGLALSGGAVGTISAILGIGGGTLTVPFLTWCNVPLRAAVGTSAAAGLPIALAGALGFAITGWSETGLPPGASGYLYWPAFGGIVVASMVCAPLGARLAHALPVAALRRLFALFLAALGARMLFG